MKYISNYGLSCHFFQLLQYLEKLSLTTFSTQFFLRFSMFEYTKNIQRLRKILTEDGAKPKHFGVTSKP